MRSLQCLRQSRINIGSDGTLARAPVWMGIKRGPPFIFWGPYLFEYFKYYKTEYKVQKYNIEKNLLGAPNFF